MTRHIFGSKVLVSVNIHKGVVCFHRQLMRLQRSTQKFSGELKIVLLNPLATNSFQREKFMLSVSAYNYSVFVVVIEESDSDFRHFGISRLSRPSKQSSRIYNFEAIIVS